MSRHCYVLSVFTDDGAGGNALGVITDVTGLDDATMQAIATDLGFSETVYLEWKAGSVPHARIFTPASELPFAGHPLVGAAWVMQSLGPGGPDRLTCEVGEVAMRVDGDVAWIDVVPAGSAVATGEGMLLAAAAGLATPVRAWWVTMPKEYLLLEMPDDGAVTDAAPAMDVLAKHFGTYIFHRAGNSVHARFFAPGSGIDEDPATGSAAVALAMALASSGEPKGALSIRQGAEMGFPSVIQMTWDGGDVSIGGGVRRDEVRFLEV